jgi:hypothetical protein
LAPLNQIERAGVYLFLGNIRKMKSKWWVPEVLAGKNRTMKVRSARKAIEFLPVLAAIKSKVRHGVKAIY